MAEPTGVGPVVIDAGVWSPVRANTFSYGGTEYKEFNILQVRRSTRNKWASLDEHIQNCESLDDQVELLLQMIAEFVPTAPLDQLRDEPWELLLDSVLRLGHAIGSDGEVRPT